MILNIARRHRRNGIIKLVKFLGLIPLMVSSGTLNSVNSVQPAVVYDVGIPNAATPTVQSPDFLTESYHHSILKFQEIITQRDTTHERQFQQIIESVNPPQLSKKSMGEIMQTIAKNFLGTPYQANLLDSGNTEKLVVSLQQFDCVLFVETVLAIARNVATQDQRYPTFINHLENQRYRNGKINGYCSRLHYFSEWISDNQNRGTVQDITANLGGIPLNKTLNFMSHHRQNYQQIARNEATYQCIVEMESRLQQLTPHYLPTSRIREIYSQLQPGDIIAIATNLDGLDVTHTGLAYRHTDGNIGLIHASIMGEVAIADDLQQYVTRVDQAIGMMVARPIKPQQP